MKIEEGKMYRCANGEVVGPMYSDYGDMFCADGWFWSWWSDGRPKSDMADHPGPIVCEVRVTYEDVVPVRETIDLTIEMSPAYLTRGAWLATVEFVDGRPDWPTLRVEGDA